MSTYRYTLTRGPWLGEGTVLFVMLNPSTADETQDDPTIRRCIRFAQSWGFAALTVVNLYGLRSTDPRGLWRCDGHPVAPAFENDLAIAIAAHGANLTVCAWGADPGPLPDRPRQVVDLLSPGRIVALGLTKDGHPRHPLYVRADAKPVPFTLAEPGA